MVLFRIYAPSECVSNWMAPHKAAGLQARAHPDPVAPVTSGDQNPLTFPGRLNGIIIPSVSRRTQLVYVVPHVPLRKWWEVTISGGFTMIYQIYQAILMDKNCGNSIRMGTWPRKIGIITEKLGTCRKWRHTTLLLQSHWENDEKPWEFYSYPMLSCFQRNPHGKLEKSAKTPYVFRVAMEIT